MELSHIVLVVLALLVLGAIGYNSYKVHNYFKGMTDDASKQVKTSALISVILVVLFVLLSVYLTMHKAGMFEGFCSSC